MKRLTTIWQETSGLTIKLALLRAMHRWSTRAYHRTLLRCELRRIACTASRNCVAISRPPVP